MLQPDSLTPGQMYRTEYDSPHGTRYTMTMQFWSYDADKEELHFRHAGEVVAVKRERIRQMFKTTSRSVIFPMVAYKEERVF